jgi:FtsP/CotA-like multicopper oxidase with cupredoxin domain
MSEDDPYGGDDTVRVARISGRGAAPGGGWDAHGAVAADGGGRVAEAPSGADGAGGEHKGARHAAGGLGSPLRYAAAAVTVVAAAAHVPVIDEHFHEAAYLGTLFTLFCLGCAVLAWMLLRRDTPRVWTATGTLCALAIVTYVVSRVWGLPHADDDIGAWTSEPLGVVSVCTEAIVVVLAALALLGRDRIRVGVAGRPWAAGAGALALAVGLTVTSTTAAGAAGDSMGSMTMSSATTHWNAVSGTGYHPTGVVRTYYIGSDEVAWNYAPAGYNEITGQPFGEHEDTYVQTGPGRIGSTYLKCLYRAYTNATFSTLQPRAPQDAYLGLLGPVIRAEVGDTIKIYFRNTCHIPTSMHPHGVFYLKDSEGAPYADNTSGVEKSDDAVPTGGTHTYTWLVPDRAGPGPSDGSSVMWMYHSHADEIGDTYAGLIGPMEITAKGMARPDGSPKDVDREVFEMFSVMDENKSPYLLHNLYTYAQQPYPDVDDDDLNESNLMHSINGYVFGNQPMLQLKKGERVRWYVMSMGTEVDLHTPHWHGNDVLVGGMRMDVVSLLPAGMVVADMVPDNIGIWLFHCHVNDHIAAGMITRYQVVA